jgi:glucosylceramidase
VCEIAPLLRRAALLALVVAALTATAADASNAKPTPGPVVRVIQTSANLRQALTPVGSVQFTTPAPPRKKNGKHKPKVPATPKLPTIQIQAADRLQTFKGVGGAMTDSSAWLLEDQLAPGTRARVMRKLFGPGGIALHFILLPIAATDFTADGIPYSYDDVAAGQADPTLADFSIAHDDAYIIPALRQAQALARHAFVLATPWSAPAWMKTNGSLANPGDDLGWLKQADYGAMAQYFVKFLRAYRASGIHIDAITPQNEPGQQTDYPGMSMSESDESALIASDLAPALRAAHLHTLIYGYDNDWFSPEIPFAPELLSGPAAADLAGISSHCYFGSPTVMSALHQQAPALDEVVSECAMGSLPFNTSQLEIASLRNWASSVALWNLALDPSGGPVQAPNAGCQHCTGIVTIDPTTHRATFTRDYYQLGQLSKYVAPGAVRLRSNHFVSYGYVPGIPDVPSTFTSAGLDDVAFQNPDGQRVLVAYNGATQPVRFTVADDGGSFDYRLAAGTTATFVWQPAP